MKKSGYKYIFGPVPSRRLGISLGVDIMPHKTCSLNCVYCECGATTNLTIKRGEYIPVKFIREELKNFLSGNPKLDFITFSGSGEPTLHTGINEIVDFIKADYPQYKLALLTNSTLFSQGNVIEQVLGMDIIIASLDAATEKIFVKINRPHPDLYFKQIIDGLICLREKFSGQLWMEFFLVPGINDNEIELGKIKNLLADVNPDKIQINTLDRPGTESWVKPVGKKRLIDINRFLSGFEVIKDFTAEKNSLVPKENDFIRFLSTLKRRPCTDKDVSLILGIHVNDVKTCLEPLIKSGKIEKKEMPRGVFYIAK
ncbi:MAG: radical SAM protein [Candidatus Desulfaltia sp.]|nr:radical SAM protein [Candidatus Desulfaltia sp.]